jgi:glycosyltransferase involved in cell wall biosynthesis/tetratricopeptide (TPR) repeat protein
MPPARRLKATVRRRIGRVAVHVPPGRGPAVLRRGVERARLLEADRKLRDGDFAGAAGVLEQLLEQPSLHGRAWHVLAKIREKQGDWSGALAASRQATAGERPDVAALILNWRLASAVGEADEARKLLGRVVTTRPRSQAELDAALDVLPWATESEIAQYETALQAWRVDVDPERLRAAEAESILAELHAEDHDAYLGARPAVEGQRTDPVRIVTRVLSRQQAWDELATYLRYRWLHSGAAPVGDLPVLEVRRAASKALAAGRTSASMALAGRVLVELPRDRIARETFDDAADQLSVTANGWSFGLPEPTPYEPNPRAGLSVLAQSLPVFSGGYATRSHGILTGLSARGWDIAAVTRLGFPYDRWPSSNTAEVPPTDVVDGIAYHRLLEADARKYPQFPLSSYIGRFADRIVDHAVAHRAALIHASSFHVNGLSAGVAATRLGLPLVYEMRGLEDLMKVSRDPSFTSSDRHAFLSRLEVAVCHRADTVFVITEALRREMADRGVPLERMVVLPNGVHASQFSPCGRDRELAAQLGVDGKAVIGYAGGLVDYEGLDLLLDAVAQMHSRRADFHVLIVGDGHYQRVLQTAADRLRLGDVVTFAGRVPHDQVGRYLSLFDIAPFPRLPLPVCELVSPIKPFESMAMEKAVVVSNVAALTEIVRDGVTGLVFRKGDSRDLARTIERLLDSAALRVQLGRAAGTWVRTERDWSIIVETVDTTYRALLDRT